MSFLSSRLRKSFGHPLRGTRHAIHRLLWVRRLRLGRVEGCCFLANAPMDYVCFRRIHRLLPHIPIVADTRAAARYLRRIGVQHTRRLGFPRCVILAGYLTAFPRGVKLIQINHGLGLAKAAYYQKPLAVPMDLYLVSGGLAKERFDQAGLAPVLDVGFPKLDGFFDGSYDRAGICRSLGIPADKPIILYAPTWSELSSTPVVLPVLPGLARDYTILVKLHDHTIPSMIRLARRMAGIKLVTDPDCTPLLFVADLLVSDVSSVVFEYALLNRPIILIQPPAKKWQGKVTDPAWWRVGVSLAGVERFPGLIAELLQEDRYEQRRFRAQLMEEARIRRDGKAALRAAQAIAAFLRQEGLDGSDNRGGR